MSASEEERLAQDAVDWVKSNQKELVGKFAGRYDSASRIPLSIKDKYNISTLLEQLP